MTNYLFPKKIHISDLIILLLIIMLHTGQKGCFFFLSFIFLGTLGKMRRNMFNTNDIVKCHLDKLGCNDNQLKTIISMLKEIKEDMSKYNYHMKMDSTDISDFFPLKSEGDIKKFMDKSHDEWPLRRRGFYHLLFTTVTKNKKKFATALLHTVFTRDFISNHRWPQPGYNWLPKI